MAEEMFEESCPFCSGNCNCNSCLCDVHPMVSSTSALAVLLLDFSLFLPSEDSLILLYFKVKKKINFLTNEDQRIQCSKYILEMLLPFLKRLNEENLREMEIEAEIQGISVSIFPRLFTAQYISCCINTKLG